MLLRREGYGHRVIAGIGCGRGGRRGDGYVAAIGCRESVGGILVRARVDRRCSGGVAGLTGVIGPTRTRDMLGIVGAVSNGAGVIAVMMVIGVGFIGVVLSHSIDDRHVGGVV